MKLFVEVYDYLEDDHKMKHEYTLTLGFAFVLIKFCLIAINELLNCNLSDKENFHVF